MLSVVMPSVVMLNIAVPIRLVYEGLDSEKRSSLFYLSHILLQVIQVTP
jgi:hypothetical protein